MRFSLINRCRQGRSRLTVQQVVDSILCEILCYNIPPGPSLRQLVFYILSGSLSNMAPEYLKNIYKNKIMNDTSVGCVSPFQSVFIQVMALLYMALWQILLQNMADVGYHIIRYSSTRLLIIIFKLLITR